MTEGTLMVAACVDTNTKIRHTSFKIYRIICLDKFLEIPKNLFSKRFFGGAWGNAPRLKFVGVGQRPAIKVPPPFARAAR